MIRISLLLLLSTTLLAAPVTAEDSGPMAVVRQVMQLEVWAMAATEPGEDQPFSDTSLARFFTADFAAAYLAVMERQIQRNEPLIDGDLIANSQEYCPLAEITIESLQEGSDVAEVMASFTSQWCFAEIPADLASELTMVTFTLVRDGDAWRIDDFDSGGSVRELFTALMRE